MAQEKQTKQTKPKGVKVFAPTQKGSALNVPHSEHRVSKDGEFTGRQVVTFDEDGFATVPKETAEALFEHYHNVVVPA